MRRTLRHLYPFHNDRLKCHHQGCISKRGSRYFGLLTCIFSSHRRESTCTVSSMSRVNDKDTEVHQHFPDAPSAFGSPKIFAVPPRSRGVGSAMVVTSSVCNGVFLSIVQNSEAWRCCCRLMQATLSFKSTASDTLPFTRSRLQSLTRPHRG